MFWRDTPPPFGPGGQGLQKGKENMETRELAQSLVEQARRLTDFARLLKRGHNHGTEKAVRTLLVREATLLMTRATGKGETMSTIQFTSVPAFLGELSKDRDLVDRGIVRLTTISSPAGPHGYYFLAIEVVATAKVGDDLVVLKHYCGTVIAGSSQGEATRHETLAIEELKKGCAELGLEIRAGVFQEE